MFQNIIKGQVIKIELEGETTWAKVTGYHGQDAVQAQIAVPFEGASFNRGDFIKIAKEDVLDILGKGDESGD